MYQLKKILLLETFQVRDEHMLFSTVRKRLRIN